MAKNTKKPATVPGKNGFAYKPRYGLLIETDDEAAQIKLFGRLKKLGFLPRVLVV